MAINEKNTVAIIPIAQGYANVFVRDDKLRHIGHIENETFITVRNVKKHLFRAGRKTVALARRDGVSAWGLDYDACKEMLARGVKYAEVRTQEGIYGCGLADFAEHEQAYVLNLQHRPQRFLPEVCFERIR